MEIAATADALRESAKVTQNCKIVLSDPQGCTALANNCTKDPMGGEVHSKLHVRPSAFANCEPIVGGGQCKVVREFCWM